MNSFSRAGRSFASRRASSWRARAQTPAPTPGLNPADVPSPGVQAGPARVSDRTDRSDLQPSDLPDREDTRLEGTDLEDHDLSDLEDDDSESADIVNFD